MNDNQFTTTMMTILGVLIALTVVILIIANTLIPGSNYSQDSLIQGSIEDRIQPIGTLAIAGITPVNASEGSDGSASTNVATNDAAGASKSAEDLYTACAVCHNTGILNSPKLGDKAGWGTRVAKGVDALYASAINGINGMPPKGGRADYSDDDIKKVVDYMLESVK